jgi:anti-sigma regulatory factor (Ser/Thr protein kinase)
MTRATGGHGRSAGERLLGVRVCGQVVHDLPSEPRSPGHGRRIVTEACNEWGLGEICGDMVLPVSELITNAFLHAGTHLRLTVSLSSGFVEVSVRDDNPRPPIVRPVRLDLNADLAGLAPSVQMQADARDPSLHVGEAGSVAAGRGLHIVDAVADEWGVAEYTDGKDVWFRIHAPEGWEPAVPCPCADSPVTTPGGLPLRIS